MISNDPNVTTTKGAIITMDFAGLHEPQCQGAERPGESGSDYELWTPNDGRHGSTDKCFMGQQVQYVRRKQDSECYNGEELEKKILRNFCTCSDVDYECDVGYEKTEGSTRCVKINDYNSKLGSAIKEDQAA